MSGWFRAIAQKYAPLDELLALPSVRIMRYLRHCDDVLSIDIYVACGVAEHEIAAYNQAICRLVKDGLVDRGGASRNNHTYRINAKGRDHLLRLLKRSELLPPLTDRELAHDRGRP